jgi:aminoglycoside 3-N-acetyltransferase
MASTPAYPGLADDLRALGVAPGAAVLVHAAMRDVAPVPAPAGAGDEEDPVASAVFRALREVLGPGGTIVVPSFTEGNSTTSRVHRSRTAGLTAEEVARFRAGMPAFDPDRTSPDGMGRLTEVVRHAPGARRSTHPQTSFVAFGAHAEEIVERHDADCHLGERSPLGWLYENDARILLIGVEYDVCSAFHLAEYRVANPVRRTYECVVRENGGARWISYEDVDLDDGDFARLGMDYETSDAGLLGGGVSSGRVGGAPARGIGMRGAVDFAVGWLAENRPGG